MGNTASVTPNEAVDANEDDHLRAIDRENNDGRKSTAKGAAGVRASHELPTRPTAMNSAKENAGGEAEPNVRLNSPAQQDAVNRMIGKILEQKSTGTLPQQGDDHVTQGLWQQQQQQQGYVHDGLPFSSDTVKTESISTDLHKIQSDSRGSNHAAAEEGRSPQNTSAKDYRDGRGAQPRGRDGRHGSDEDTHHSMSESSGESSSGESFTSSTYSETEEESDQNDGNGSDDTFYMPEDKKEASSDEGEKRSRRTGDRGIVVQVANDGEQSDHASTRQEPSSNATQENDGPDRKIAEGSEKNPKSERKSTRTKRKRLANRHYIQDSTMRTLFGLMPFYSGGDNSMDQIMKATLASVGSNNIDVRDQEGNTLLVLACQHGCEDLVDVILAKGADPLAVNGVGICALHYTCFSDSLSLDATEALLWRGADPSVAETIYGCTPLHYAASAGDVDLCSLLMEHGGQPQAQDFYTYTAVKYARDAGHDAIVELLGGDAEGETWPEASCVVERYDAGEGGAEPSRGLWCRHIDPETGLAYHMNDETGESWWETDLMAVAKDFLEAIRPIGCESDGSDAAIPALPPLGVREWLVQEQVRSWLIALLAKSDPMRLMEVDLILEMGKADFKGLLEELVKGYGLRELDFLHQLTNPKLGCLEVSSLLPSKDQLGEASTGKSTSIIPGHGKMLGDQQGKEVEGNHSLRDVAWAKGGSGGLNVIDAGEGGSSQGGGNTREGNKSSLRRTFSSAGALKQVDSRATLRVEADKQLQEAEATHQKELVEERQRQKEVLDEQRKVIDDLEEMAARRQTALKIVKEQADEGSKRVADLQSTLRDDSAGQDASDRLSEEIAGLKAGIAAEKVRFSHMAEALEATKGSLEERAEKQQALEDERQARLERLKSDNTHELEALRMEANDSLVRAEEIWDADRKELERGLTEQVAQTRMLLDKTLENAAKVLSEATTVKANATEALKQATTKVDNARAWMKINEEEHSKSKQIDQTNKQLNASLRRELERAKQLHNQIEDMKGQTRVYARVRPMDDREKSAACKEVCLRDGKQTLAFLTAAQQHWSFTQVFQNPSMEPSATAAAQAELHRELAGLGTSVADGHSVLLLAAGAKMSGKTLTLVGEPKHGDAEGGFFEPNLEGDGAATEAGTVGAAGNPSGGEFVAKKGARKAKAKGGGGAAGAAVDGGGGGGVVAKVAPLAGLFPRLLAETFATLTHRSSQCAFTVMVSAAAVTASAAATTPESDDLVECLLPPAPPPGEVDGAPASGADGADGGGAALSEAKEPHSARPPPSPPDSRLWGRAIPTTSPHEVVAMVEAARSRAAAPSNDTIGSGANGRHFLSKIRVELLNHSTKEISSCEMVIVELAEETSGTAWAAGLAEAVRAHATASAVQIDEADGTTWKRSNPLLEMLRGCLADTAKVVTLLCVSPADSQAERTERALYFGKGCQDSGEGGAAQLKDLKKELARLKKEGKGAKKNAPSQLPRPAGGRRP